MMERIRLPILRLQEDATLPGYAHPGDAGMDVCAWEEAIITPGERVLIGTGIAIAVPPGYEVQVRPRSGLALRYGLTVLNTPGTIDSGYRGEVKVLLINHGRESFAVTRGMRIAQLVLARYAQAAPEAVSTLDDTDRGDGGYGSTGI